MPSGLSNDLWFCGSMMIPQLHAGQQFIDLVLSMTDVVVYTHIFGKRANEQGDLCITNNRLAACLT